jgi:hypothetical protein
MAMRPLGAQAGRDSMAAKGNSGILWRGRRRGDAGTVMAENVAAGSGEKGNNIGDRGVGHGCAN